MPILDSQTCTYVLQRQQYLREHKLVKTTTGKIGEIIYKDSQYFDLDTGEEELSFMIQDLSQQPPTFKEKLSWFYDKLLTGLRF